MKALRMGLIGSILSTFGGICGTLWNSAYMAYGIPFVSYYFGIILHDRYFKDQIWFYPVEWILQMETGERIKRDCGYFCYYFYWC